MEENPESVMIVWSNLKPYLSRLFTQSPNVIISADVCMSCASRVTVNLTRTILNLHLLG